MPGKFHGQRSQVDTVHGIAKESDTTETLNNNNNVSAAVLGRLQAVGTRALLSKGPTGKWGCEQQTYNSNKAGNVHGALGSLKRHGAKASGSWRALSWEVHLS